MYGIPLPVTVNNVLPLIAVIKEMPLELYASFIVVKLTLLSRKRPANLHVCRPIYGCILHIAVKGPCSG